MTAESPTLIRRLDAAEKALVLRGSTNGAIHELVNAGMQRKDARRLVRQAIDRWKAEGDDDREDKRYVMRLALQEDIDGARERNQYVAVAKLRELACHLDGLLEPVGQTFNLQVNIGELGPALRTAYGIGDGDVVEALPESSGGGNGHGSNGHG